MQKDTQLKAGLTSHLTQELGATSDENTKSDNQDYVFIPKKRDDYNFYGDDDFVETLRDISRSALKNYNLNDA